MKTTIWGLSRPKLRQVNREQNHAATEIANSRLFTARKDGSPVANYGSYMRIRALKTTILLSSLILTLAQPALSGTVPPGGDSGGGGLGVDGAVLDLYEGAQGAIDMKEVRIQDLPVFKNKLLPRLRALDQRLPGVAADILAGLKNKTWYFTDSPIEESGDACLLIKVKTQQLGKQDDKNVVLNHPWYRSANDSNQEAILLHELVTAKVGQFGDGSCSTNVREIVRILLTADQMSTQQLVLELARHRFGAYLTSDQVKSIADAMKIDNCGIPYDWSKYRKLDARASSVDGLFRDARLTLKVEAPKSTDLFDNRYRRFQFEKALDDVEFDDYRYRVVQDACAAYNEFRENYKPGMGLSELGIVGSANDDTSSPQVSTSHNKAIHTEAVIQSNGGSPTNAATLH